jgi:hypothetical protein
MIPRPNVAVSLAPARGSYSGAPGFPCFDQLADAFGKHRIRHPLWYQSLGTFEHSGFRIRAPIKVTKNASVYLPAAVSLLFFSVIIAG